MIFIFIFICNNVYLIKLFNNMKNILHTLGLKKSTNPPRHIAQIIANQHQLSAAEKSLVDSRVDKYPVFKKMQEQFRVVIFTNIGDIAKYDIADIPANFLVHNQQLKAKLNGFLAKLIPFFHGMNSMVDYSVIDATLVSTGAKIPLPFPKTLSGLKNKLKNNRSFDKIDPYVAEINFIMKNKAMFNIDKISSLDFSDDELIMLCAHELTHICMEDYESTHKAEYKADAVGIYAGTLIGANPKAMHSMLQKLQQNQESCKSDKVQETIEIFTDNFLYIANGAHASNALQLKLRARFLAQLNVFDSQTEIVIRAKAQTIHIFSANIALLLYSMHYEFRGNQNSFADNFVHSMLRNIDKITYQLDNDIHDIDFHNEESKAIIEKHDYESMKTTLRDFRQNIQARQSNPNSEMSPQDLQVLFKDYIRVLFNSGVANKCEKNRLSSMHEVAEYKKELNFQNELLTGKIAQDLFAQFQDLDPLSLVEDKEFSDNMYTNTAEQYLSHPPIKKRIEAVQDKIEELMPIYLEINKEDE